MVVNWCCINPVWGYFGGQEHVQTLNHRQTWCPESLWCSRHCILLHKLFFDGITWDDWLQLNYIYTDMSSVIKWEVNLSTHITIRQGVRQGEVISTDHYKRYDNPLLIEVKNRFTRAIIGYIQVPYVTDADDVALLTYLHLEMQFMLGCSHTYARWNRYESWHEISNNVAFWHV